jgi:diphthine synthase
MLYLIGLGLYDENDISLKGLHILKDKVDIIYAEFYTNVFSGNLKNLESLVNDKKIISLSRSDLEEHVEENLLKHAKRKNVALLVPGDPMVATTHISIILKAQELRIETKIVHASSIYTAIAEIGLQIYKFGRTSSIPFPEKNYFPHAPYDALKENLQSGLHTLFLLDVKDDMKPESEDGKKFMSIKEGIEILLAIEEERKEDIFTKETFCVGIARLGSKNQKIRYGKAKTLLKEDFGEPPHVIIVPGRKLHFMEEEALRRF